jgi:hypothetical protein
MTYLNIDLLLHGCAIQSKMIRPGPSNPLQYACPQPCRAHAFFGHVTRTNVLGSNAVRPHMPPRLENWYLQGSSNWELHQPNHGTPWPWRHYMHWGANYMTSMYCSTHRLTDIGRKAQIHRCQNRRLKDILDQQKNHRSNDYAAVHARAKFKLVQHCTRACLASQFASDNDGDFPRLRFSA